MDLKFTVSSPKIDTTHLPEDQPIHLLHEARDCYSDATPPFAKRNVGNNANGTTKRIVLATIDGKYPQLPTIVESISRRWDEYYTFATVDLNCKRRIVMSLSGGPKGGARYILWQGVEKGFAERPIGFTEKDIFRESTPSNTDSSDEEFFEDCMEAEARSTSPLSSDWNFPKDSATSSTSAPATPSIPTSFEPPRKYRNEKANQFLLDKLMDGYNTSAIRIMWKRETGLESTESAWKSRFWRLSTKGLTKFCELKGGRDVTPEAAPFRFRAVDSRYTPESLPYFQNYSGRSIGPSHDTGRRTSEPSHQSMEPPIVANAAAGAQPYSTLYSYLMTPRATPVESPSIGPSLTSAKLAKTTLRIADAGTFTPIKLRSCPDSSALFAKVMDICGLTSSNVKPLKLTFDWVPEGAKERNMHLRETYEDSFEIFVETVDEAPCWAEGGKCTVGVEAVLSDKVRLQSSKGRDEEDQREEVKDVTMQDDRDEEMAEPGEEDQDLAMKRYSVGQKRPFSATAQQDVELTC